MLYALHAHPCSDPAPYVCVELLLVLLVCAPSGSVCREAPHKLKGTSCPVPSFDVWSPVARYEAPMLPRPPRLQLPAGRCDGLPWHSGAAGTAGTAGAANTAPKTRRPHNLRRETRRRGWAARGMGTRFGEGWLPNGRGLIMEHWLHGSPPNGSYGHSRCFAASSLLCCPRPAASFSGGDSTAGPSVQSGLVFAFHRLLASASRHRSLARSGAAGLCPLTKKTPLCGSLDRQPGSPNQRASSVQISSPRHAKQQAIRDPQHCAGSEPTKRLRPSKSAGHRLKSSKLDAFTALRQSREDDCCQAAVCMPT
ncbi:hypothetical protein B0T14DRAFT_172600 [Immersiella caudata]|uniref:Secreted protein n=1 Tax=Immersiella caudata TaxID=314043 RepID=A0AA39WXZ3_9PEZI|nr:hypothetical protein B0T14DRAFT_172600 [Immersiella caudata]